MLIAGNTQVLQPPNVWAEFKSMVALDKCPVIRELELLHLFDQRAVAVVIEAVAKIEPTLPLNRKVGHVVGRGVRGYVQAQRTSILGKGTRRERIHKDSLAVPPEAEIHQQVRL